MKHGKHQTDSEKARGTEVTLRSISSIVFMLMLVVGTRPALGTKYITDDATGGDGTSIGDWDWPTKTCTLTGDVSENIRIESDGITLDGAGYTVGGPGADSGIGIRLYDRTGITIKNINVRNFDYGIHLQGSNDNTLTHNNTSSNYVDGIRLRNSSHNKLTDNKADWNNICGINLFITCHNNTVTGNDLSNSVRGILVFESSSNKLTENTVDSCIYGIQLQKTSSIIATDNTVTNGRGTGHGILLLNSNGSTLERNTVDSYYYTGFYIHNSSNNSLTENTANSSLSGIRIDGCTDFILRDNSASLNVSSGFNVVDSTRITLTANAAQSNGHGVSFTRANECTLTGNVWSSNNYHGIQFFDSDTNELKENTISNNCSYGIWLNNSSGNQIYNNNFICNTIQAGVGGDSTGNVFSLPAPVGGNYWDNWASPDDDSDGFVDFPHVFTGGQDNLPWADPDGWACRDSREMIHELADQVMALNLQNGISNSLDAKLAAALQALEDVSENNDAAAINTLDAFINAVGAQSGSKISESDADALIFKARRIIDCMRGA